MIESARDKADCVATLACRILRQEDATWYILDYDFDRNVEPHASLSRCHCIVKQLLRSEVWCHAGQALLLLQLQAESGQKCKLATCYHAMFDIAA